MRALRNESEHVQVKTDHHLPAVELPDFFQQRLLWIRATYSAGVRTVMRGSAFSDQI